ncbi:hypothetical protein KSP39_PZI015877 [Platanthera zijinensis]|uniref:Uncharacterized protein n=1 Tax=Platanthera zijinensis TaxID=2320716 RepID=A0AAP0B930_9ASPA
MFNHSRYEHSLSDVIKEIYHKMEFFSFDGHNVEGSESVPASYQDGFKLCENLNMNNENIASINADNAVNQQDLDTKIEQQLNEAQERRNRARRFLSFTSWVPDLQRVWAPRHPMSEKLAHEILPKVKAKKRKRRRSSIHDRVCETP